MSSEDVDMLLAISEYSITRDQALHILDLSNNNVEAACNKLLDEGVDNLMAQSKDSVPEVWDRAFHGDRYGQDGGDGNNIPTFNIDYAPGVENYPHSDGPSGAPTRPSSRTSHRSNVSTHAGDAPRRSVEMGQESGVVPGNSAAVFGPANQSDQYYDNSAWAMVLSNSTEYIPDASIWYQSREEFAPAFLKPSTSPQYLPALLTILHTIPLYRNALLTPNVTNDDYNLGNEWWKGSPEAQARLVHNGASTASSAELDFIYETQRLVAFMDNTTRAYASLDTMFQLDGWKKPKMSPEEPDDLEDDLVKYLLRWSFSYKKHHPEADLDGIFQSTVIAGGKLQKSFVLDALVYPENNVDDPTLYDILDDALFDSLELSAHIAKASEVLILRLSTTKSGASVNCVIPPVLHADRYLEENKVEVESMFARKRKHEEDIKVIDAQLNKLKFHRPQKADLPETMDTLKMIKTSMDAFDPEKEGESEDPTHSAVLIKLTTLYDNIQRKLENLEEEKKKISDALSATSASFRASIDQHEQSQNQPYSDNAKHPYRLQGVATSPVDYYVLHPSENQKPNEPTEQQWWHIKYHYQGDSASIDRNKVTIEDVCKDASASIDKTLLVYANDAAHSVPSIPLTKALEDFVKADNLVFSQDLERRANDNVGWEGFNAQEGNAVIGDWNDGNQHYYGNENSGFEEISAYDFHKSSGYEAGIASVDRDVEASANNYTEIDGGDSGMGSSRTLTPSTEVDDAENLRSDGVEMKEVNGGVVAWAGMHSNASSETVGLEPMEMLGETQMSVDNVVGGKVEGKGDVEMLDALMQEVKELEGDSRVEHIEVVEKKVG